MATIFGPAWNQLTLEAVRSYISEAEGEPLLWEAKGGGADAHHVRRTVCAFANSHDGGYLILGAEETATGFDFPGIQLPDEPALWVSNVVRDGVRPWPSIDVAAFPTKDGRHTVVVWTPPLATPPCITRGTVFERIPGASPAVKDAARLAELYRRGEAAHADAQRRVDAARLWMLGDLYFALDDRQRIGLILATGATGYRESDLSAVLFTDSYESAAHLAASGLPSNEPEPSRRSAVFPEWSQDAIVWRRTSDYHRGSNWTLRVHRNGTVAISWFMAVEQTPPTSLVDGPVANAWRTCLTTLAGLGATSSHHLSLTLLGRQFNDLDEVPFGQHPDRVATLRRGPLALEESADQLKSMEREIRRVLGQRAHEPEPAEQAPPEQA